MSRTQYFTPALPCAVGPPRMRHHEVDRLGDKIGARFNGSIARVVHANQLAVGAIPLPTSECLGQLGPGCRICSPDSVGTVVFGHPANHWNRLISCPSTRLRRFDLLQIGIFRRDAIGVPRFLKYQSLAPLSALIFQLYRDEVLPPQRVMPMPYSDNFSSGNSHTP